MQCQIASYLQVYLSSQAAFYERHAKQFHPTLLQVHIPRLDRRLPIYNHITSCDTKFCEVLKFTQTKADIKSTHSCIKSIQTQMSVCIFPFCSFPPFLLFLTFRDMKNASKRSLVFSLTIYAFCNIQHTVHEPMFNVETKKIRKLLRLMDYCLYWQVYIAFNE